MRRPSVPQNQRVEGVDLSPDGRTLAFDANRHGNADVFRIPLAGGEPVQLTDDPAVVYSATIEPRALRWRYHAHPVAGGAPRLLLEFDARTKASGGASFDTDGRRLVFTLAADDADVWTMELRRP